MAISRAEIKNAFRESISNEFIAIPRDETQIDYVFSNKFEKRMAKLVKSEKKKLWPMYNTAYKRVALIVAILMFMFITACSVPAVREGIVNFVTEIFSNHNEHSYSGDVTTIIETEYYASYIPDGFEETERWVNEGTIDINYENEKNGFLNFSQTITASTQTCIDNENATIEKYTIAGYEVTIYTWPSITIHAFWVQDRYDFEIVNIADDDGNLLTIDEITKIIESVKAVE